MNVLQTELVFYIKKKKPFLEELEFSVNNMLVLEKDSETKQLILKEIKI